VAAHGRALPEGTDGQGNERRDGTASRAPNGTILRRLPNTKSPRQDQRLASRGIAVNSADMPLYMDIHELGSVTAEEVAKAHAKDMETQRKYGVEYTKYWVNEKAGKVFCLCDAPNAEAAEHVHREAHGLLAEKIIEVQPELAEGFLGGVETNAAGAVILLLLNKPARILCGLIHEETHLWMRRLKVRRDAVLRQFFAGCGPD